jgi:methylaspartate mutase epsilon subunit
MCQLKPKEHFMSGCDELYEAILNGNAKQAEAVTIPTKEDIATSFRCARMATTLLKGQKIELDPKAVKVESEREELEVRLILDKVIDLGDGDVAIGTVRAVEQGILDNPFSTSPFVAL